MSTGMLGLAGRRGAGRSALARMVLEDVGQPRTSGARDGATERGRRPAGARQVLAVDAPSPPRDNVLSFFLVLFRRVCEEARKDLGQRLFEVQWAPPPPAAGSRDAERVLAAAAELVEPPPTLAVLTFALVLVSALPFLTYAWRTPSPDTTGWDWAPTVLLGGVVVVAVGYSTRSLAHWRRRRQLLHERPVGALYVRTQRELERLAFEEAASEEREGSLAVVQGLSLRVRRSRALKERPQTLPAVLDQFADYLRVLRTVYPGGVVIHIEDADRTQTPAGVRELLLGLRATLVSGLLYLVPLPERVSDAEAGLESLLEDVVVVPPMTVPEALDMLRRRRFFVADGSPAREALGFAICLASGGVPKAVLRLMRRAIAEGDRWSAAAVVARAWEEEAGPARETLERATVLPPDVKVGLLARLDTLDGSNWSESAWASIHADVAPVTGATEESAAARLELARALLRLEWRAWAGTRVLRDAGWLEKLATEAVKDPRIDADTPWPVDGDLLEADRLRKAFMGSGLPARPASGAG